MQQTHRHNKHVKSHPPHCDCPHSADSPHPFLFTSTSLLFNHALISDEQQVTGNDRQKWINCTIRGDRGQGLIFYNANSRLIASSRGGSNTVTSELNIYTRNGLYYCLQSTRTYFSVYLKNSSKQFDAIIIYPNTSFNLCT